MDNQSFLNELMSNWEKTTIGRLEEENEKLKEEVSLLREGRYFIQGIDEKFREKVNDLTAENEKLKATVAQWEKCAADKDAMCPIYYERKESKARIEELEEENEKLKSSQVIYDEEMSYKMKLMAENGRLQKVNERLTWEYGKEGTLRRNTEAELSRIKKACKRWHTVNLENVPSEVMRHTGNMREFWEDVFKDIDLGDE